MNAMRRFCLLMLAAVGCWLTAAGQTAGSYERNGNVVTIRPEGGQARVIQLEVVNDNSHSNPIRVPWR